jgi:hypothetical protein
VSSDLPDGLRAALGLPLVDAVLSRRSRRVGLGMSLPEGAALEFASRHAPLALSELEEAFLVWVGTGTTGLALGDLPRDGLTWMHGWTGRSWPCSCNSHSTELLYTNDSGLYAVTLRERQPEDGAVSMFGDRPPEETLELALRLFRESSVRLEEGRADLPRGEPGLFGFNAWNVNQPGTTLFVPVTNTTIEYLTLLYIYFDEAHRFTIVDELSGGRPCGLEPWMKSGRIRSDVTLSLFDLELRVLTSLNVEQAFICQNMALALQALGLGGWTFTGFMPHHLMGADPSCRGLGFRFVTTDGGPRPLPSRAPVGRDGVLEALCPPYVADMEEAVRRFLAGQEAAADRPYPYERPDDVLRERGSPTEETTEIVAAFCTYVHETYGRFPAFLDPMFVRLVIQAHHLDTEFYDRHFRDGAYTALHRDHLRLWHPEAEPPA